MKPDREEEKLPMVKEPIEYKTGREKRRERRRLERNKQ